MTISTLLELRAKWWSGAQYGPIYFIPHSLLFLHIAIGTVQEEVTSEQEGTVSI